MQINPRPMYAPASVPSQRQTTQHPASTNDPRQRGRDASDTAAGPPTERVVRGEFVEDATGGPRDRVNAWRQVDPALRPAIDAYEQMQTLSPRPGREAGSLLDRFA